MLGLGAVGVVAGAAVQRRVADVLAPITAADRTGLTGLLPAAGGFRIYSVTGDLPRRDQAVYRLRVHGLVSSPLDLSFSDLEAMTPTSITRDFQCVTGWRVPDVPWVGVRLADLLDLAGADPTAAAVTFRSFDGVYTESLTMAQARRDDVLVAYRMQGRTVSAAHGGPVRLYVAPMYGYKSLKWLDSIEVAPEVVPGYWERRGYDIDAWVGRSNERSDDPT